MKKSNKVFSTVIVTLITCFFIAAIVVRIKLDPNQPNGFIFKTHLAGKTITKNYDINKISDLDINGSAYVSIEAGERSSLIIAADEYYMNDIDVTITGSKLIISVPDKIKSMQKEKVNITFITPQPLNKITTSGTVKLNYATIKSNKLVLESSGASQCYLSGKITSLQIEISGASQVDAKDLLASEVSLDISGAANISVHAIKSLIINASGMAHINYYGNPKNIVRDISGMASINDLSKP